MLGPSSVDDSAATPQSHGGAEETRTARLTEEYRRLAREFAFHPTISVIPVAGEPPESYQVEYRVRSVVLDKTDRKLQFVDSVALILTIGETYPDSAPTVRPPEGLFLPNADDTQLRIEGAWRSGDWLVRLLPRLGDLLAYRKYDPAAVINVEALNWQQANVASLPTDKSGDFKRSAGGAPAERIGKYASARIAEVRGVLEAATQSLGAGEMDPDRVRDTAAQARYVLLPMCEEAGDAGVIASAKELTAWSDDLANTIPAWSALRERQSKAAEAQAVIDGIPGAIKTLNDGLAELSMTFTGTPANKPAKALGQIPLASVVTPLINQLGTAVGTAQRLETAARSAVLHFEESEVLNAQKSVPLSENSPIGTLLAQRQWAVSAASEKLTTQAGPALAQLFEALARSRAELTALRRLGDWRDYLDEFIAGTGLARGVLEKGAAGVQAFVLESSEPTRGPYQFEQPVSFGAMQVSVGRNADKLQIIDAATGEIIGSRVASVISLRIPTPGGETTFTVRAAADCATIANRLDSARTRTYESLSRLHDSVPEAQSWCGRLLAVLCEAPALAALHAEHRRSTHRWDRLAGDLLLLAQFKDRLSTFYLVQRSAAAVQSLAEKRSVAEQKLDAATERLAALAARCDRDPHTEKLLVPPQLAGAYGQAAEDRQSATKEIQRIQRRERELTEQIAARVGQPSRVGRAEIPTFRRLGAIPAEMVELAKQAVDAPLAAAVSAIAARVGISLPPIAAVAPVDLSGRKREKRPNDLTGLSSNDSFYGDAALALRPEDSVADVTALLDADAE